jgi:hypothetical protein
LRFRHQVPIPVEYNGRHLDCAYRADFVVCDAVLLEIKGIEQYAPIHMAQLLTYLRLLNLKEGLLINFNVRRLVDGVKRVLNEFVVGHHHVEAPRTPKKHDPDTPACPTYRRGEHQARIFYVSYVIYVVNTRPGSSTCPP